MTAGRALIVYELAKKINVKPVATDEEAKKILFGQSQATVK